MIIEQPYRLYLSVSNFTFTRAHTDRTPVYLFISLHLHGPVEIFVIDAIARHVPGVCTPCEKSLAPRSTVGNHGSWGSRIKTLDSIVHTVQIRGKQNGTVLSILPSPALCVTPAHRHHKRAPIAGRVGTRVFYTVYCVHSASRMLMRAELFERGFVAMNG